jgi:L-rhamnose-H+ transport protein
VTGLLVVPSLTLLATVAHPWEVYRSVSAGSLGLVVLFGVLWGISAILFGLGVARVGVGLGFALILGISSVVGSVIPLVTKHGATLFETAGLLTLAGVFLQVTGVAFCGVANQLRQGNVAGQTPGKLRTGLIICCLSGLGAPFVNLGLVFGSEVAHAAERLGTSAAQSANALWPLLFGGAFVTNAAYCVFLIRRGSGWQAFRKPPLPLNFLLAAAMGVLWMGSNLLYMYGTNRLGPLGLVFGWPIMMGCIVLTANAWGIFLGEWNGASRTSRLWMIAGTGALLCGIGLIGMAAAV